MNAALKLDSRMGRISGALMHLFTATHPEHSDLMRFEDDGGRVPERDHIPLLGATLRIRMPVKWDAVFSQERATV